MKQRIKQLIMGVMVVLGLSLALVPATSAINVDPLQGACANNSGSAVCKDKNDNISTTITQVVNVLLFVVGALSVIMIIVAGIMYTTSTGDSSRIKRAKDTLTYAVAGLVIAFLAFAIVNWVITQFV
ncbi:MAG: pilin [Candidatus Saccharimonadales bacterium]